MDKEGVWELEVQALPELDREATEEAEMLGEREEEGDPGGVLDGDSVELWVREGTGDFDSVVLVDGVGTGGVSEGALERVPLAVGKEEGVTDGERVVVGEGLLEGTSREAKGERVMGEVDIVGVMEATGVGEEEGQGVSVAWEAVTHMEVVTLEEGEREGVEEVDGEGVSVAAGGDALPVALRAVVADGKGVRDTSGEDERV